MKIDFKYPLVWPGNEPTHDSRRKFKRQPNLERTIMLLHRDAKMCGIMSLTITSNHLIQNLRSINNNGKGPAVTVFFNIKDRQFVICQDRFDTIQGNLYSIAKYFLGKKMIKQSLSEAKEYELISSEVQEIIRGLFYYFRQFSFHLAPFFY